MAIKSLKALTEAGLALREARDKKNAIEEAAREAKKPLEAEIEKLEADLLGGFRSLEMNSFKLNTGETITRSVKQSAAVTDEHKAIEWAKTWNGVKLDLRLVQMKLKQDFVEKNVKLPDGFEMVEKEEVRVTVPKPKSTDEGEAK